MDHSKQGFKLGLWSTIFSLILIVIAFLMPPAGLPVVSKPVLLVIAFMRFVVGVGISAILAFAAYFICFRAPRVGATVYCLLVILQILGVYATSQLRNGARAGANDPETQRLLSEVDRQRDETIARLYGNQPTPRSSGRATASTATQGTGTQPKRPDPVVRVYKKP